MNDLELRINRALDEIRPFLNSDGGDVSLIEYDESEVKVKFEGNCQACSINQMTLKSGIESTIKKYAPEIQRVIQVV